MNEHAARQLVDTAYRSWSNGDIETLLAQYIEDLTFWSNIGGAEQGPLVVRGKPLFRSFVEAIAATMESTSVLEHFRLTDGIGYAKVDFYVRHKLTGHVLTGSYRQVTTFRDGRIESVEQFHDAARTAAFYRLLADESTPR